MSHSKTTSVKSATIKPPGLDRRKETHTMMTQRPAIPMLPPSSFYGLIGEETPGFNFTTFETSIATSPQHVRTHRHAYHELMVFHTGEGLFSGDFREHPIMTPAVVVIPSGVVHWWPDHQTLRGAVLGFDADILGIENRRGEGMALFAPPVRPVIPLDSFTHDRLKHWLALISEEWQGSAPGRREMLCAALTAILVEIRRFTPGSNTDSSDAGAHRIYQRFMEELERQVASTPSPRSLAQVMGITPDHLSASLRAVTSRPAGTLIAERVILEAKRLLIHSNMGVAEAAYALGFESPSYFSRFFRKHTGESPREFRVAKGSSQPPA